MNRSKEYSRGLSTEQGLIDFLRGRGVDISNSTKHENCDLDIDCWVTTRRTKKVVPVSIKTQHTALHTGNICFELELTTKTGGLEPGWFSSGEASIYWIIVGHQLYRCSKKSIQKYVEEYGWKRKASLSAAKRQSQKAIGHWHINSEVGLLGLKDLVDSGVLKFITEIPRQVAYPP